MSVFVGDWNEQNQFRLWSWVELNYACYVGMQTILTNIQFNVQCMRCKMQTSVYTQWNAIFLKAVNEWIKIECIKSKCTQWLSIESIKYLSLQSLLFAHSKSNGVLSLLKYMCRNRHSCTYSRKNREKNPFRFIRNWQLPWAQTHRCCKRHP